MTGFLHAAEAPPGKLTQAEIHAFLVEDVAIPIPHEIFSSLDKLGERDWRGQIRRDRAGVFTNRLDTAMILGLVIANGFVAVQAEDAEEVKRIGRDVLRLAEALGVKDAVVRHTESISEHADAADWEGVRTELDNCQESVRQTMKEMRDGDVAELVSVGGWLGGTHVVSSLLASNYDPEASELLNQPDLLAQIRKRFEKIPAKKRGTPALREVEKTLAALKPLLANDSRGTVPSNSVGRVRASTARLVDLIYNGARKGRG